MSKAVPLTSEFLLLSIFKKFGISSPFLALPVYIYILFLFSYSMLSRKHLEGWVSGAWLTDAPRSSRKGINQHSEGKCTRTILRRGVIALLQRPKHDLTLYLATCSCPTRHHSITLASNSNNISSNRDRDHGSCSLGTQITEGC